MRPARFAFHEARAGIGPAARRGEKEKMQRIEKTFAGRKLVIETGRMAKQAAGSGLVTYGDTMVLATVTVSDNKSPLPFFPLTVEYKREDLRRRQDPRRLHQARRPAERRRDPELPDHRPLHPPALPRGLPERSPGLLLRHLGRPGERRRRARPRRHVVRAADAAETPFARPDRRRPRRPRAGQLGAQPHLPAARVQRHGARRRRLGRTRS